MEPDVISVQDEQNRPNKPDRKRFTRKNLCLLLVAALVILTVLLFLAVNIYHTPDYNELLTRAKLAKLPESVKNLQVDTRPFMSKGREVPNQGELFIGFQAEPNDIDSFINNSPIIDKNSFRPLPPSLDSDEDPAWWPTDQSTSGRMYVFREREDIVGMVAVYDDSNTVRIWMVYIVNPQLRDMQNFLEDLKDSSDDFFDNLLHEVQDLFD